MDRKRSDDGVARVVAWHNRHPLAHHIEPEQVVSAGHVELPFRSRPGQPRSGWRVVFREKFLPGLSVRQIARWALRHGDASPPAPGSGPLRQIEIDTPQARDDGQAELLWLRTAAVVFGQRQSRVLLSSTDPRAVLGRRIWSRPRQGAVVLLLILGLALPALRRARGDAGDEPEPPSAVAVAVAEAPVEVVPPMPPLEAPMQPAPPETTLPVAPEAPEAVEAPAALPPPLPPTPTPPAPAPIKPPFVEAEVRRGTIDMPSLRPQLDETIKAAAREARAALHPERAVPAVPTFALALRRVRTQAESELMGRALRSILARSGPMPGLRFDAMPAGDDWRAVCWPFATREEAERVRQQLTSRGQAIEVISF
jgi:hypothetical protein